MPVTSEIGCSYSNVIEQHSMSDTHPSGIPQEAPTRPGAVKAPTTLPTGSNAPPSKCVAIPHTLAGALSQIDMTIQRLNMCVMLPYSRIVFMMMSNLKCRATKKKEIRISVENWF